jgi:hypothetical protein
MNFKKIICTGANKIAGEALGRSFVPPGPLTGFYHPTPFFFRSL